MYSMGAHAHVTTDTLPIRQTFDIATTDYDRSDDVAIVAHKAAIEAASMIVDHVN